MTKETAKHIIASKTLVAAGEFIKTKDVIENEFMAGIDLAVDCCIDFLLSYGFIKE